MLKMMRVIVTILDCFADSEKVPLFEFTSLTAELEENAQVVSLIDFPSTNKSTFKMRLRVKRFRKALRLSLKTIRIVKSISKASDPLTLLDMVSVNDKLNDEKIATIRNDPFAFHLLMEEKENLYMLKNHPLAISSLRVKPLLNRQLLKARTLKEADCLLELLKRKALSQNWVIYTDMKLAPRKTNRSLLVFRRGKLLSRVLRAHLKHRARLKRRKIRRKSLFKHKVGSYFMIKFICHFKGVGMVECVYLIHSKPDNG